MSVAPETAPRAPTRRSFSASTAAAVGVAAAAMVATLPGRTHGLGLITEPLLAELALDRVSFAALNFWATLVGAAFCVPVGWLLDRFGVRAVLGAVLLALGAVVLAMTGVAAGGQMVELAAPDVFFAGRVERAAVPLDLFLLVLLTRGLGQSALSVVSLALVGKVARAEARRGHRRLLVPRRPRVYGRVRRGEGRVRGAARRLACALWSGLGWALVGVRGAGSGVRARAESCGGGARGARMQKGM